MVRVALAQINPTVGDLDGNVDLIAGWAGKATAEGADVVCFPELALTGYPPEDLVLRPEFVQDNLVALDRLAFETRYGSPVLVGFVDRSLAGVHNAAALLHGGGIVKRYHKMQLPNYGVFDEQRTFVAGETPCPVRIASAAFGVSVCEDAWTGGSPFDEYARLGARVIVNINGSPFHRGKISERIEICRARAAETGAWIVYVNMVGGQDELVFDGGSMVVAPDSEVAWRSPLCDEDLLIVDLDVPAASDHFPGSGTPATDKRGLADPGFLAWPAEPADVYGTLVLGLRDYVQKNGFAEVVLGLSGGIDSALVATLAVDALGAGSVHALAMPSRYSSPESLQDATDVATRLGIKLDIVPIDDVFTSYLGTLEPMFARTPEGLAEENVQARIRGNLLMALSNKFGSLVLATGNKSEYAVGYSTLYGDMAGGFAPIKDVPKTLVYELCAWRNGNGPGEAPIPEPVMTKPPSAELRPDQKDTDSLPPYAELDPVIEAYVEHDRSPDEIIMDGFDPALVEYVVQMIDRAEYKRRQAPPGVKITPKAFGRDRRLPITNRYGQNR